MTSPPRTAASRRVSGSPSPVPRTRPARSGASWTKSSNTRVWSSSDSPTPVSATANRSASPSRVGAAETRTSPASVNFMALTMKLRRICDSLKPSV